MKNRYTAAIFAFLFGWLGFHKFYLGKWFQGILYILFMFTMIPTIVSILEGILYLVNKQEWFDLRYNLDYMRKQAEMDQLKK